MKKKALIKLKDRDLFMSFSLVTFDYFPYLFVAQDESKKYYLCHCSETRGGIRWIVTQTSLTTVKDLLNNRITMRNALAENSETKYLVEYESGTGFKSTEVLFGQIDEFDLPEDGLYLEYPDDDAVKSFTSHVLASMYARNTEEHTDEEDMVETKDLTVSIGIYQPVEKVMYWDKIILNEKRNNTENKDAEDLSIAA